MKKVLGSILGGILLITLAITAVPIQAADPLLVPVDEQPKDTKILSALTKAGVDKNYVSLLQDYGKKSDGKSPYVRVWADAKSLTKIAEISHLPMADANGLAIIAGWNQTGSSPHFTAKNNLFGATVSDLTTTLTAKNDQIGKNKNDTLIFTPELYVGGIIRAPTSNKATLLAFDPLNGNYVNNTLVWAYPGGIERRARIIEGQFQGYWVVNSNPGAGITIQYNQTGNFKLSLGKYKFSDDIESVSLETLNKSVFPLIIQDSATFYPDANPETTTVDGYVQQYQNTDWATIRGAPGTGFQDDISTLNPDMSIEHQSNATQNNWQTLRRSIYLFNTTSIPSAANITAATFSLYGDNKTDALGITPGTNVYSSAPASNTALAAGDFDSLGTTPFSTNLTYSAWSVSGYNDFVFNANGIAAITKGGITKLGIRTNYDAENIEPPSATPANGRSGVSAFYSEMGAGFQPRLVVTYIASSIPTVTTQAVTSIGTTTATGNGNVTNSGGANVTLTGVEWGTSPGVYTASANTSQSLESGAFTQAIASLTGGTNPATTYYLRAFADNNMGRGYGSEVSFTTLGVGVVATNAASGVTMTAAGVTGGSFNGTLSNTGNPTGHVWFQFGLTDTYGTNTTAVAQNVTGVFTAAIPTNLTPGSTYHYRATANNTQGSVNGTDQTFIFTMPTITTGSSTQNGLTATLTGSISSLGAASSTYGNMQWGYNTNYGNTGTQQTISATGDYTINITNYDPTQTIHYRAMVTNGATSSYGADQTFTPTGALPNSSRLAAILPIIFLGIIILTITAFIVIGGGLSLPVFILMAIIILVGLAGLSAIQSALTALWGG